jgi:endonuclease YncB( thermonuclease family)
VAPKCILQKSEYTALLRDIQKLRNEGESAASGEKVKAQWHIGARIKELKLTTEAGYHNSVIRDLAHDTGLAMTTLRQAVQFAEAYRKPPSTEGLSWSHYRLLLRVKEKAHRDFYVQKVIAEGWTSKQLESAITAGLHEGKAAHDLILERPTEPHYVYAAKVLDVIDGDTLDLAVDVGFGVFRHLRVRLAVVNCDEPSTKKGREARAFVAKHLISARSLSVQTIKVDLHGRYVVHLFFAERKLSALDCFLRGTYLNDLLVQKKLATVIG